MRDGKRKRKHNKARSFYHRRASSELSAERDWGPHTEKVAEHGLNSSPHGFSAETQSYQESEMHRAQPRGCMKVTLTWDTGTLAQHLFLWVPCVEVTVCEVLPIAVWPLCLPPLQSFEVSPEELILILLFIHFISAVFLKIPWDLLDRREGTVGWNLSSLKPGP